MFKSLGNIASMMKQAQQMGGKLEEVNQNCLLYTSPSPRDLSTARMPSSA